MRTKLVIPEKWVQELNLNRETKIFLSDDEEKPANFTAPIRYFLQNTDACYNGIYLKSGIVLKDGIRVNLLNIAICIC